MTIINLRSVGRGSMTPRQWHIIRDMIQEVRYVAFFQSNQPLFQRALNFLNATEGYDV